MPQVCSHWDMTIVIILSIISVWAIPFHNMCVSRFVHIPFVSNWLNFHKTFSIFHPERWISIFLRPAESTAPGSSDVGVWKLIPVTKSRCVLLGLGPGNFQFHHSRHFISHSSICPIWLYGLCGMLRRVKYGQFTTRETVGHSLYACKREVYCHDYDVHSQFHHVEWFVWKFEIV